MIRLAVDPIDLDELTDLLECPVCGKPFAGHPPTCEPALTYDDDPEED